MVEKQLATAVDVGAHTAASEMEQDFGPSRASALPGTYSRVRPTSRHARNILSVDSFSAPGKSYKIDPDEFVCTCEDWRAHRAEFSPDDPRRLCKHLTYYLFNRMEPLPDFLRAHTRRLQKIYKHNRGFPLCRRIKPLRINGFALDIYMPLEENNVWVEIHAEEGVYGYNLAEKRWSWNYAPPGAKKIEAVIHEALQKEYARLLPSFEARPSVLPRSRIRAVAPSAEEALRRISPQLFEEPKKEKRPLLPPLLFVLVLLAGFFLFPSQDADRAIAPTPPSSVEEAAPLSLCRTVGGYVAAHSKQELETALASAQQGRSLMWLYEQGRLVILNDNIQARAVPREFLSDKVRLRFEGYPMDVWTTSSAVVCN